MIDFRRITLFCLEKRLSKHKMTIFLRKTLEGIAPLPPPPGYADVVVTGNECQLRAEGEGHDTDNR